MSVLACKEWAVVVRALACGEQLIDIRKGGLREDGGHFEVPADRCWLFPTYEHQRASLIKPAYRRWVEAAAPDDSTITIPAWAEISGTLHVEDPDDLAKLEAKVVWTSEYVASRLRWKKRDPLTVLALRVHELTTPLNLPNCVEYAGCTSWVHLADAPPDPSQVPSTPALSDTSFTSRIALIERDLGREFQPVATA